MRTTTTTIAIRQPAQVRKLAHSMLAGIAAALLLAGCQQIELTNTAGSDQEQAGADTGSSDSGSSGSTADRLELARVSCTGGDQCSAFSASGWAGTQELCWSAPSTVDRNGGGAVAAFPEVCRSELSGVVIDAEIGASWSRVWSVTLGGLGGTVRTDT